MLGPHFYYDIIRLARKGWPTWLRVLYLLVLLLSLTVMYKAQGNTVNYTRPADLARYAHNYAYTLIVLQQLLVLVLLPVYVASAVVEERENGTLEPLFLTHLSDRELVLGKLGARVMHLGMVVFAGFPLLAYMHLWGNVDFVMILYHELFTFLLLLGAASVCIWMSTRSESAFQAISSSYPYMFVLGLVGIPASFIIPGILGGIITRMTRIQEPVLWYYPSLVVMASTLFGAGFCFVYLAVGRMVNLRLEQAKKLKKATSSITLSDAPAVEQHGKRWRLRSRIHPLALPVGDRALFWKECMKDGTRWSLTFKWFLIAAAIVMAPAVCYRLLSLVAAGGLFDWVRSNAYSFTYTSYFIALTAYVLVVIFQTTLSVAGEHEHATLVFLLLIPEERRSILFNKWLGPLWRNWPILGIAYLGVLFGLVCGLYSIRTALVLWLLPIPPLLMLSFLSLFLSVFCRRVLFANIGLVGFLGARFVAHVAAAGWIGDLVPFYIALLFETPLGEFTRITWEQGLAMAFGEQVVFLCVAGVCAGLAFLRFQRKDYAAAA